MGAGRSATDLIDYLLQHAQENQWEVTVGDMSLALATQKIKGHALGKALAFNGGNAAEVEQAVAYADVVVSLLPPPMHPSIARECLKQSKHLVTASYVSAEMAALDAEAKAKGLIFLNEIGADPGIDHMSLMRGIDAIKAKGGKITDLRSYCGSLIAPESNDNPWGYKFTWSPMNVIVAGQGAACWLSNGKRAYIPYNRLFSMIDPIRIEGFGDFDAYANRDSFSYKDTYNIPEVQSLLRGTLRMNGFCEGWNALIRLGLTANDYKISQADTLTYKAWVAGYVPDTGNSTEESVAAFLQTEKDSALMQRLIATGMFSDEKITRETATPAEILYDLLMSRWVFREEDKDMLVMADKLVYEWNGKKYEKTATMGLIGKDFHHTAISQTVGLPAAMGVKLILQNKVEGRGVLLPITPDIYHPILDELTTYGIVFKENTVEVL